MRLIEIRGGIIAPQIQRIVPGKEETKATLLVERVRPGIRSGDLKAIGHAFVHLHLKGVVVEGPWPRTAPIMS